MNKPRLEILSDENDPVLKGRCSSCDVTFSLSRTTQTPGALMLAMFSEHVRTSHINEAAKDAVRK